LGLDKWLVALWVITSAKNGVSSYEISRALGITQKSAWFMMHRLRLVLQDEHDGGKLSGEVEVDETFIGGKARFMHAGKRAKKIKGGTGVAGKIVVMGLLERQGRVRTKVVENVRRRNLDPHVRENVEAGSTVYTDALPSYESLADEYAHHVIDHAETYVRGNVHTNGMENFWSLLKRGIKGTYVSVEPFHLFRYLDEQAFRFNTRKLTDRERFEAAIKCIAGKRLTYDRLIGECVS
jgi:transposase-like protein